MWWTFEDSTSENPTKSFEEAHLDLKICWILLVNWFQKVNSSDASELSSARIQLELEGFQLGSAREIFEPARPENLSSNELNMKFRTNVFFYLFYFCFLCINTYHLLVIKKRLCFKTHLGVFALPKIIAMNKKSQLIYSENRFLNTFWCFCNRY